MLSALKAKWHASGVLVPTTRKTRTRVSGRNVRLVVLSSPIFAGGTFRDLYDAVINISD